MDDEWMAFHFKSHSHCHLQMKSLLKISSTHHEFFSLSLARSQIVRVLLEATNWDSFILVLPHTSGFFCTRRRDTIFLHICLPPYHHFMMFFLWFWLQFATFHRRINFEVKSTRDFFVWDKNAAWGQWLWKKLIKEKFVCENLNAGQWLRDSMASYNWKHTSTWYSLWMTIWKDYSSIQNMYSYSLSFIHSFVSQFDVHCLLYFACAHARVLPFMCNKYTEPWWQHTKIIYVDFFSQLSHIWRQQVLSIPPS